QRSGVDHRNSVGLQIVFELGTLLIGYRRRTLRQAADGHVKPRSVVTQLDAARPLADGNGRYGIAAVGIQDRHGLAILVRYVDTPCQGVQGQAEQAESECQAIGPQARRGGKRQSCHEKSGFVARHRPLDSQPPAGCPLALHNTTECSQIDTAWTRTGQPQYPPAPVFQRCRKRFGVFHRAPAVFRKLNTCISTADGGSARRQRRANPSRSLESAAAPCKARALRSTTVQWFSKPTPIHAVGRQKTRRATSWHSFCSFKE